MELEWKSWTPGRHEATGERGEFVVYRHPAVRQYVVAHEGEDLFEGGQVRSWGVLKAAKQVCQRIEDGDAPRPRKGRKATVTETPEPDPVDTEATDVEELERVSEPLDDYAVIELPDWDADDAEEEQVTEITGFREPRGREKALVEGRTKCALCGLRRKVNADRLCSTCTEMERVKVNGIDPTDWK